MKDLMKNDYLKILDDFQEFDFHFDEIVEIASHISDVKTAFIAFDVNDNLKIKSRRNFEGDLILNEHPIYRKSILDEEVFILDKNSANNQIKRFSETSSINFCLAIPLLVSESKPIGCLCVMDAKERTVTQKEIEVLQLLSKQIIERLELKKTQIETELAHKAKSTFLANMSHEIRTPLNGMLGCANLLYDNVRKKENIELLNTIVSSGDILLNLINDILDFSKIESGHMGIESEPFNLSETIDLVVQLFQASAEKKSIKLIQLLDNNIPQAVLGDVTRLRQILNNLISNAVKFTNEGAVTISAHSEKIEGTNRHKIFFSVQDEGIGISEDEQSKLFQSFSQVDASTVKKYGGTGLGLVISKALIEMMGGKIELKSLKGHGTTIKFHIECEQADTENLPIKKKEINSKMAETHPLRILLAEDNRVNQMVAKKLLEKVGYRIDVAGNGFEAISMLENHPYDLILMDCQMPEMDGYTATKHIKEKWDKSTCPRIIALTASTLEENKRRCKEVGMQGFLSKPIVMEEVVQILSTTERINNIESITKIDNKQETEASSEVLNQESFFLQFGNDMEMILELSQEFVDKVDVYVDEVETNFKQKNSKDLEISAHSLKGAASNFYAQKVVDESYKLEVMGREETFEGGEQAIQTLRKEVDLLKKELIRICQENKAA